jgi:hypothetical protein
LHSTVGEADGPPDRGGALGGGGRDNINITVQTAQPLCGWVLSDEGEPRSFQGWLQLMRILADLLTPETRSSGPRGDGPN